MKHFGFIAVLSLLLGVTAHAAQVGLIKINGAIGPATATYIARALETAAAENDECLVIQLDTMSATPVLGTALASSAVHEVFAHPLGRSGEELAAAIEVRPRAVADQAQVGFVDQRRRFERLTGLPSGHLLGRQLA